MSLAKLAELIFFTVHKKFLLLTQSRFGIGIIP